MNKEKVLIIATTFPRWENDTEATFVKDLCIEISKEFEVHVLVPHYKGLKFKEKVGNLYMHRFPYFYPYKYQKLAYGGILPNLKKNPLLFLQAPFLFISMLINTIKIIKNDRIKVIHAHWFFPQGLIAALCTKYFKIKSMVTIHAGGILALNSIPLIKRPISNFILKNTTIVISVSSFGKNLLKDMVSKRFRSVVENKLKVIPMGVYTKRFNIKKDKQKLKEKYGIKNKWAILFIGRLAEKKGVKYLIKALPLIKNLNYILLIIGEGPLKKDLIRNVNKLNLNEKVKFLGYVSEKEKIDYLLLSNILIVPSITTKKGDTEGLPAVIMEGVSTHIPIIATDVGGIRDIIKNNVNGILIEEKNSKQIVEKIGYIIDNKKFREKLIKNAKLTSKNYDWRKISKKNIILLNKLINSRENF